MTRNYVYVMACLMGFQSVWGDEHSTSAVHVGAFIQWSKMSAQQAVIVCSTGGDLACEMDSLSLKIWSIEPTHALGNIVFNGSTSKYGYYRGCGLKTGFVFSASDQITPKRFREMLQNRSTSRQDVPDPNVLLYWGNDGDGLKVLATVKGKTEDIFRATDDTFIRWTALSVDGHNENRFEVRSLSGTVLRSVAVPQETNIEYAVGVDAAGAIYFVGSRVDAEVESHFQLYRISPDGAVINCNGSGEYLYEGNQRPIWEGQPGLNPMILQDGVTVICHVSDVKNNVQTLNFYRNGLLSKAIKYPLQEANAGLTVLRIASDGAGLLAQNYRSQEVIYVDFSNNEREVVTKAPLITAVYGWFSDGLLPVSFNASGGDQMGSEGAILFQKAK